MKIKLSLFNHSGVSDVSAFNPSLLPFLALAIGLFSTSGREVLAEVATIGLTPQGTQNLDLARPDAEAPYFVALESGVLEAINTPDEWLLNAETGDLLQVSVSGAGLTERINLRLLDTANSVLRSVNGSYGAAVLLQDYSFATPGSYRIEVNSEDAAVDYQLRVILSRSTGNIEVEPNNSVAEANSVAPEELIGSHRYHVAGALDFADLSGDYYLTGNLDAGVTLTPQLQSPVGGGLALEETVVELIDGGGTVVTDWPGNALSDYLIPTAGAYSLRLRERYAGGQVLEFSGADHIARIPDNPLLDLPTFTIEFWVKQNEIKSDWQPLVTKQSDTGSERNFGMFIPPNDRRIHFSFARDTGSYVSYTSDRRLNLGEWTHIAMTYDGSDLRLYMNGLLEHSYSQTSTPFLNDHPVKIGNERSAYNSLGGQIDELRIWDNGRSADQIAANYAATSLASTEGLVGYWRMNEESGDTLIDSGPNALNGQLGDGGIDDKPVRTASDMPLLVTRDNSSVYLFAAEITDDIAPEVTDCSLPTGEYVDADLIDSFTVTYSEEVSPAAANLASNYELLWAGLDGVLDTADDYSYALSVDTYSGGLSVNIHLTDGVVQVGDHRFTVSTGLVDLAGNPLSAEFTRNFSNQRLGQYMSEFPGNSTRGNATTLTLDAVTGFSGSWEADGLTVTSPNIVRVRAGEFFGDGITSIAALNRDAKRVELHVNDGNAVFEAPLLLDVGNNPWDMQVADLDGNGRDDIVVSNRNDHNLSLYLAQLDGSFNLVTLAAGGTGPCEIEIADVNGDGSPDILAALRGTHAFAAFLNNGSGVFTDAVVSTVASGTGSPEGISTGDFDNDGFADVALASYAGEVNVFWGSATTYDVLGAADYPDVTVLQGTSAQVSIAAGDFNGDGFDDIALSQYAWNKEAHVIYAAGARAFDDLIAFTGRYSSGYGTEVRSTDIDGDGYDDMSFANYYGVSVIFGGTTLSRHLTYGSTVSASSAIADLNSDNIPDLLIGYSSNGKIKVHPGLGNAPLFEAPLLSGAYHVFARGRLTHTDDADWYQFQGTAAQRMVFSTETIDSSSGAGLNYTVYLPDGSQWWSNNAGSNGELQRSTGNMPVSGIYTLRVGRYYNYFGEYRFHIMLDSSPWVAEQENNGSIGAAQALNLALESPGNRSARIFGKRLKFDGADFYTLGYLAEGAQIDVSVELPFFSTDYLPELSILRDSGAVVEETAGVVATTYTVPADGGGSYSVRIDGGSKALASAYLLSVDLTDSNSPQIIADSLPPVVDVNGDGSLLEPGETDGLVHRFSITSNKDLNPSTVNTAEAYDLREAGADGNFDTEDDVVYEVNTFSSYSAAQSVSLEITDGPLASGNYRFQVKTSVEDLFANALAAEYQRFFSVIGVAPFVTETRSNDSYSGATDLATRGAFSGTFIPDSQSIDTPSSIVRVRTAALFADGTEDIVLLNRGGGIVQILPGNGDGSFGEAIELPTQSNPWDLEVADLNKDGRIDIVVSNASSHTLSVYWQESDGSFTAEHLAAGGNRPYEIEIVDLDGDTNLDLIAALRDSHGFSVLRSDGTGGFESAVFIASLAGVTYPEGIAAGDFDNDGFSDVAIVGYNSRVIEFRWGNADAFATIGEISYPDFSSLAGPTNPNSLAAGDFDGNGYDDLVISGNNWEQNAYLIRGYGGRVWTELETVRTADSNSYGYEVRLQDIDADGYPEILNSRYYTVGIVKGYPELSNHLIYGATVTSSAAVADINSDGIPDLLMGRNNVPNVLVNFGDYKSNGVTDTELAGVSHYYGRGHIRNSADNDKYRFHAERGQRVQLAVQPRDSGSSRGLHWRIMDPTGRQISSFYPGSNGTGQNDPLIISRSGTYYVQVVQYYGYYSEYQFRLSLIPEPWVLEKEDNGSLSQGGSNAVQLDFSGANPVAHNFGSLLRHDSVDYYAIANIAAGTDLRFEASTGGDNPSDFTVEVHRTGTGNVQEYPFVDGVGDFTYSVTEDGFYSVAVSGSPSGLDSLYFLRTTLIDAVPPEITGDSLPAEGSTTLALFDGWTLTFSEEMSPDTVNNPDNYDLRAAGVDGLFDTADDEIYRIARRSNYSSGLNLSLYIEDGPLQPGDYRFTVSNNLRDTASNAMTTPYVRTFSVENIDGFVVESRDNNNASGATPLSYLAPGAFEGSYGVAAESLPALGYSVTKTRAGDLNGDGNPDIVALNRSGAALWVHMGDGSRELGAGVEFATGSNPFDLQIADIDADGNPDILVSNQSANSLSLFMGDGSGNFGRTDLDVGGGPSELQVVDMNGDGRLDIIMALRSGQGFAVLWQELDGSLTVQNFTGTLPDGSNPEGVAAGDFNADGNLDIALALYSRSEFAVTYGTGLGNFSPAVMVELGFTGSTSIAAGDCNDDGRDDLILGSRSWVGPIRLVLSGSGDSFTEPVALSVGNSYTYEVQFLDPDGDGSLDILASRWNGSHLFTGNGDGSFLSPLVYGNFIYSSAISDLDSDGVPELILANNNNNRLEIYTGNRETILPADDQFAGMRHIFVRGRRTTSDESDYYKFSGKAGEILSIASETPGGQGSSGLGYRLRGPGGGAPSLSIQYANSTGVLSWSPVVLPYDGTYYIEVAGYYGFQDEYNFRLSIAPAQWELESENNNSISQADALQLPLQSDGSLASNVMGYFHSGEPGDFYGVGLLSAGTRLQASWDRPAFSSTDLLIQLRNSNNEVIADSSGTGQLDYTLSSGQDGALYIVVTGSPQGLSHVYQLQVQIVDETAPYVVALSLPEAYSESSAMIDLFNIDFSEGLDPTEANSTNNYDLRNSGEDGVFGTFDDVVVPLQLNGSYSSGVRVNFSTTGPLQPGYYRLRVSDGLTDLAGNTMAETYEHYFSVVKIADFTVETEPNGTLASATPLEIQEIDPTLLTGGGRGRLVNNSDIDFWSFEGIAGDRILLSTQTATAGSSRGLYYQLYNAAGSLLVNQISDNDGSAEFPAYTIPDDGIYFIRVSVYYGYYGEYQLRLTRVAEGIDIEAENNNTIAEANPVTMNALAEAGNAEATVTGKIREAGDLDYFHIGEVLAGSTLFLSARVPDGSPLQPVVGLYNAANQYQSEVAGGVIGDSVAEIEISTSGDYYALIRASGTTHGFLSQYLLDIRVAPTGGLVFPNLTPTALTADAGSFQSGDAIGVSFTVENAGLEATGVQQWFDQVVLSPTGSLADPANILLLNRLHTGGLASTDGYSVTESLSLPDGIEGDYFIGIATDTSNLVNEFLFEGDNVRFTDTAVTVTRRPYPDLVIEGLAVEELGGSSFRITWNTANRGSADTAGEFNDRIRIRRALQQTLEFEENFLVSAALPVDGVLERSADFTAVGGGLFLVEVRTDSADSIYEFNTSGSVAAAQNNVATADFAITRQFAITLDASPLGAGSVSGAGTYPEGQPVTVVATANTSVLPYAFAFWEENGIPRSTSATYTFTPGADRALTAVFRLPQFFIGADVSPGGSGSVGGKGFYDFAATAELTAHPQPGYFFDYWETGAGTSTENPLQLNVAGAQTVTAVFGESNPTHAVTVETAPAGVVALTGAGTYNNSETLSVSAPANVEAGDIEYLFQRWQLNGQLYSGNPAINHDFTTLEPPSMAFVAQYTQRSLRPVITGVTRNRNGVVPAGFGYILTLVFDREMDTSILPTVTLLSGDSGDIPEFSGAGEWVSATQYTLPAVQFGAGQGGLYVLSVADAQDSAGRIMDAAQPFSFNVDVVAPVHPIPELTDTSANSATLGWGDYVADTDLSFFRLYRETVPFSNLTGLDPIGTSSRTARSVEFSNLELDTTYYVFVAAVDAAGNMNPEANPVTVTIASEIPPAVDPLLNLLTLDSAELDWSAYLEGGSPLGLASFLIYLEPAPFSDVSSLTPLDEVDSTVSAYTITGLDRNADAYLAVVGVNRLGEFDPAVSVVHWSDPLSGTLTRDFTFAEGSATITENLIIDGGARFAVAKGSTLRFAEAVGLEVLDGVLEVNGTALDPVVFTSVNDTAEGSPQRGDWNGILISGDASASILRHLIVQYGFGIEVTSGSPVLDTVAAFFNADAGLLGSGNAVLNGTSAFLAFNEVGLVLQDSATAQITGAVIKGNAFLAAENQGSGSADLRGNWWGATDPVSIAAGVQGIVDTSNPLDAEPILTAAFSTGNGLLVTGENPVALRLMSLNAESYRVSENSTFADTVFVDIPRPEGSGSNYLEHSFEILQTLTPEAGQKNLFLQFSNYAGELSETVSLTLNYVTDGPVITAFNLTEGALLNRPYSVSAAAEGTLDLAQMRLLVEGAEVLSSEGALLSGVWDIRDLVPGSYRVRLEAVDIGGNVAAREFNVVVQPLPPQTPSILDPLDGALVNASQIAVSGTAEPGIQVRISNGPSVVGTVQANASGQFSLGTVALNEGSNLLIATAFDTVGEAASSGVTVVLNTRPPSGLELQVPTYDPAVGHNFLWNYLSLEDQPTRFRLFLHPVDFSNPADADFASPLVGELGFVLTPQQLADGDYFAAVQGYDGAGNAGPLSDRIQVSLDRTAPTLGIAFDQSSPVGPGNLGITLTSAEPLQGTPTLSLRPQGGSPVAVPLTAETATRFSGTYPVSELSARTGTAQFIATARDLSGNRFSDAPEGPSLAFDVTRPQGSIVTDPESPISIAENTTVEVTLTLTKPPAPGGLPELSFIPPVGDTVVFNEAGGFVAMTADRLLWRGTMDLGPANGNGSGSFTLSVEDAVGNVGTSITSGASLELYNTALPTPPGRPVGLHATTLPAGEVLIEWNAVDKAETYSIYREAGEAANAPTELLITAIAGLSYTDLPPADGVYSYVVTATRRGSQGEPSGILEALSDRVPPPAPVNFNAELMSAGVQITWDAPTEGEPPYRYNVYRNDTRIRTVSTPSIVTDAPPRGAMQYRVASVDRYGNEASTDVIQIDLFVGAVANLQARLTQGNPPVLQWTRPDSTAIGVHIYRNGIRQTATPTASLLYVDALGIGTLPVEYSVRAVNAEGRESAPKIVRLHPFRLNVKVNTDSEGSQHSPVLGYFDSLDIQFTNLATSGSTLSTETIELVRTQSGAAAISSQHAVGFDLAAGGTSSATVVQTAPKLFGVEQSLAVRLTHSDTQQGNTTVYQQNFVVPAPVRPQSPVAITLSAQPLAGGLTNFTLNFKNRGYVPVELLVSREFGQEPGDIYLSIQTVSGFEVAREFYAAVPPGAVVRPNGDAVVELQPSQSVNLPLQDVLIPDSLGEDGVARFEAVAQQIHYNYGTEDAQVSGPLSGTRTSDLTLTPYFGTAMTDKQLYSNSGAIIISGQAINRATGDPLPETPLKIGFSSRGYQWFEEVVTDTNGDYIFEYTPQAGFSGGLRIWAAHPDVFDELDQAEVQYLRLYLSPSRGDIVMSRSDTLDFSLTVINPSDIPLTAFTLESTAFILDGEVEVPISGLTAEFAGSGLALLPADQRRSVRIRMTAALDVPEDPFIVVTLSSAEGATTEFIGRVSLKPALAVLSVESPSAGYVEVSLDRQNIISREVTLINQGLRALTNVRLTPPQNIPWFLVNVPVGSDGTATLKDIPVGGKRTFTVVFAPPEDVDLGFYNDTLTISGDNAISDFTLNLYAQVTSNLTGSVQFAINNMFGDPVPNARIRLRNEDLRTEIGPVNTDALGQAFINDLQEGDWSWQISASGHSVKTGTITILPDQTATVESTLDRSLVTVNFTVVPKPFTDRYEILVEQTFETRVPFPVLVLTPPHFEFSGIEPGFETTVIVQAKNEGLIRMINVEIEGSQAQYGEFTPLITYLPELGAQEIVEIPFRVRFYGRDGSGFSGSSDLSIGPSSDYGDRFGNCLSTLLLPGSLDPNFLLGLAALANAQSESFSGALLGLSASIMIGFDIFNFASTWANPLNVLATVVGCAIGSFISPGDGSPNSGYGGPPGGGFGFYGLGCFTENTPVWLKDGSLLPIQEIQAGMEVLTDGYGSTSPVSELIERESENLYHLTYSGPAGLADSFVLEGTGEHRIWTDNRGWVALQALEPGEWIHHGDGSLRKVLAIEKQPGTHSVYTLEVDGDNAFYAGGILVQDNCGGMWLPTEPTVVTEPHNSSLK